MALDHHVNLMLLLKVKLMVMMVEIEQRLESVVEDLMMNVNRINVEKLMDEYLMVFDDLIRIKFSIFLLIIMNDEYLV
jgi:hypothetical protein